MYKGNIYTSYFVFCLKKIGVRELFEPDMGGPVRKTRGELMRDVDADYYGYRDDDDNMLEPLEAELEAESGCKSNFEWSVIRNYYVNVPSQDFIRENIIHMKKKALTKLYVEGGEEDND